MNDKLPGIDTPACRRAVERANAHGAGPLPVDGYQQTVDLCGHVANGWLFRFGVVCNLNIPEVEQESFAGAAGCLVTNDGQVRDLPGPVLMDMLRALE